MKPIKPSLKDWLPPALVPTVKNLFGKGIRFDGNYSTWDEAAALCDGYDAKLILEKVLEATLQVKRGEAAFERDSVLFDEIQYSWPVTAALMWASARNSGDLHVLDFGGSLGSGYFQNRKFLSQLQKFSWSIVEQRGFVDTGNQYVADDALDFYADIDSCCANHAPNIVLISSVLQYLDEPFGILKKIAETKVDIIVIDRTPFSNDSVEKIKIQHVPSEIYAASYPCWFFNYDELLQTMNALTYKIVESFDALDRLSSEATWKGLIFEKDNKK